MPETIDIDALLLAAASDKATTAPADPNARVKRARARSTQVARINKREKHAQVLDSVGGDAESLKTITLWEPRKTIEQVFCRAYDRAKLFATGNAFHDVVYEVEATEYKLIEVEVERARHPDEEVAFAKLQRRFIEQRPSIQRFFHKPSMPHGDRRQRRVMPAPLGDFNWCDRDEVIDRENRLTHSLAALRAARPIRNVNESK